ncbi:MAG TPA: DUF4388 domain-containing protein [Pyrinomonadaceae bacterium]|nr:DUF4388 domain-containing protein [Pyrinomonadaceae bacterium]
MRYDALKEAASVETAFLPRDMKGHLHEHPLVELIREISTARLTGALRLAHERAKTVVYFDDGEIIYAISNLRIFRMSECLRRWGMIKESEMVAASEAVSDVETGASLVARGAVTEEALAELRARQVADMLRPAMLWIDGSWEFDARVRLAEDVLTTVGIAEISIEAARRLPHGYVASRFTNPEEKVSPVPGAAISPTLNPEEAFVMTRVMEPLTIRELLALSGLPSMQTFMALYALVNSGIVKRGGEPRAFTDEEMQDAISLKGVSARAAAEQPAKIAEAAPEQKQQEAPAPAVEADEERELQELFARLDSAESFYRILGIERTASPADVKRAYYSHAKRFHPDKFRQHADAEVHARVESAFAAVAQAYETLKDQKQRAAYDLTLTAKLKAGTQGKVNQARHAETSSVKSRTANQNEQRGDAPVSAQDAEKSFKRGVAALEQGAQKQAVQLLGVAASAAPNNADYRAYFGRALAFDAKTRRRAETEIQAAIAIDGQKALYHIFLAELYRDVGLHRRAQTELERALSVEPQNAEARRLLDSLIVKK